MLGSGATCKDLRSIHKFNFFVCFVVKSKINLEQNSKFGFYNRTDNKILSYQDNVDVHVRFLKGVPLGPLILTFPLK